MKTGSVAFKIYVKAIEDLEIENKVKKFPKIFNKEINNKCFLNYKLKKFTLLNIE